MSKFFQYYPKRYVRDRRLIRVGRMRIYLDDYRPTWMRLGLGIAASGGQPEVHLDLFLVGIVVVLWSHRDDCECDECLPF